MIVGEQKPFDEIWEMVKDYNKLTVVACNTCVAVCHQGGNKEAELMASLLRMKATQEGLEIEIVHVGVERQCEHEFYAAVQEMIGESEAVLSLGCGIGVQFMAEKFQTIPVYPGLNTKFIGDVVEKGVFQEKCQACGDCLLGITGGVCPITRCAKRVMNGPCGGSTDGKCEISKDQDCAWQLIINRLEAMGKLDRYEKLTPIKDWSKDRAGGPRKFRYEEGDE